jgi:hypothetical protein
MAPRDPDELELDAARTGAAGPDDTADIRLTRRLGATARALTHDDLRFDEPPPGLWDRIAARAAADLPGDPALADHPDRDVDTGEPEPGRVVPIAPTPPRHLGRRPRRSAWLAGVAAAAAAVVVVAGAVAVVSGDDDDGTVLASAQLGLLPDAEPGTGTASAAVVERDGASELDMALQVPAAPGFYEVWLIDESVEGMVSLGPLRSDGRYQIPPGVDVGAFPIVDVSIEPTDGVPTHSGRSVLRGTLS